ncbi:hypothetical protein [uncultured Hymenobacter sp.]|uniref:hypothetical protein n=1 Tax=uncultured Hymenobacter sp. TaxID=170016 RepID=UPI0035CBB93F
MRIITALATLLVVAAGVPALAQTELNTPPTVPTTSPKPGVRTSRPPVPIARPTDLSAYRTSTLGIDLGWGGPYGGLGINYAYLIGSATDINVGVGYGFGSKISIGVRQYLSPASRLSPYLGINLTRSGMLDSLNVTLDEGKPTEEQAIIRLAKSTQLHLRAGVRWQPSRVGLIGTVGYGVRLSGDPATYTTPTGQQASNRMRNTWGILSPGGLEISFGMSIGLGR